ncbi:hydroxysqualene dehydroxylase HpnE [Hydrogenophaga sp. PAMC20947]|uniref:hydroxysqualene dehydroxylase HpnE n=1 Tax=Hydrogenophaga sp. PAMC20947 TaxID=2565558 RepID=UPI001B3499BB|nr:hydroxysqualene dehydroxylase HpnE [Hydrogenophaga sp. PAMC20947]
MKLAIVGAGWAGMAAAVTAAQAGAQVTIFEASRNLGGRARALSLPTPGGTDITVDNGQHILIGAYTETLRLMQLVGVAPQTALLRQPLAMVFPDGRGLQTPAWAAQWPAPLNAVAAIATAKGWHWRDKLALVRASLGWQRAGFLCETTLTVAQLCVALPPRVIDELIEPLCVSALNTPGAEASAAVFLRVMQDALFGRGHPGFGASDLLMPRTDLSQLFPQAATEWLASRHGDHVEIHLSTRVHGLRSTPSGWQLEGAGSTCFDQVIWATGAVPAAQAMANTAEQDGQPEQTRDSLLDWSRTASALPHAAITTVYAHAPGARLQRPMMALRAQPDAHAAPAQFVFDRGLLSPGDPTQHGMLAFVVSASEGDRADLQRRVLQQACDQLGLQTLRVLQTVVEKRATFACTPGLRRPGMAIAPALWAAGDFVEGPYPATLEGAVRSGVAAAQAACQGQTRHLG